MSVKRLKGKCFFFFKKIIINKFKFLTPKKLCLFQNKTKHKKTKKTRKKNRSRDLLFYAFCNNFKPLLNTCLFKIQRKKT